MTESQYEEHQKNQAEQKPYNDADEINDSLWKGLGLDANGKTVEVDTEETGIEEADEDYEDYEEMTEEMFLQASQDANVKGGANAPSVKNQISQKNYAMGFKTESIKSPCIVVMVAEKPSIAQSICKALSGGKYTVESGPARMCPIYVYSGFFKGNRATFKVTSVAGHVFNRDFSTGY